MHHLDVYIPSAMEAVDHEEQEVKEEQKKRKQQGIASIDV